MLFTFAIHLLLVLFTATTRGVNIDDLANIFGVSLDQDDVTLTSTAHSSPDQIDAFLQAKTRLFKKITEGVMNADAAIFTESSSRYHLLTVVARMNRDMQSGAAELDQKLEEFKKISTWKRWMGLILFNMGAKGKYPEIESLVKTFKHMRPQTDALVELAEALHQRLGTTPPDSLHDLPKAIAKANRMINRPWRVFLIIVGVSVAVTIGAFFFCLRSQQ